MNPHNLKMSGIENITSPFSDSSCCNHFQPAGVVEDMSALAVE